MFPEGYGEVERLPEALTLANPHDAADVWLRQTVASKVVDGRLHVTVRRRVGRAKAEREHAGVELERERAELPPPWAPVP